MRPSDKRLSAAAKDVINDDKADIYLSIVSPWEIAIKISLDKLKLSQPLSGVIDILEQQSITLLTVKPSHILAVLSLPFEHRDPFDRLLVSQVLVENMKFISNESLFLLYGVDRIW